MTQTIHVSAGGIEYTRPLTITELEGKDITQATVKLALGGDDNPDLNAVYDPSTSSSPTPHQRTVRLLIGDSVRPQVGDYTLWWRVTDTPEVIWRPGGNIRIE